MMNDIIAAAKGKAVVFLVRPMVKKAAAGAAAALAGFLASHVGLTDSYGLSVSIDPDKLAEQIVKVATAGGVLLGARNFLKVKFPRVFGWL